MRSKISFFSRTIFLKNMTRFWPIGVFYFLAWLFIMPINLWGTMTSSFLAAADGSIINDIITTDIYRKGFITGSWLIAVFGILAAMGVFSYLYTSRSACMFHALPVRREGLFVTNYLSGLSFLLVPNVIIFILTMIVEAACGHLNLAALLSWLGVVSALSLLFYSFGAFCAMFTGNIVALPVFYVILNVVAVGAELMIKVILSTFVFGMTYNRSISLGILSPWYQLNTIRLSSDGKIICWGTVITYAVAGAVLTVLALFVYRKRRVESAGDIVAVRPARPVFKYGAAFCFALFVSYIFYHIPGAASIGESFWRILVCMLAAGIIGYYLSDMLLKKTFRVIRSGFKGCLIFSGALLVLLVAMKLDIFGYEQRVPDTADISRAYIDYNINLPKNGTIPMYFYGLRTDSGDQIAQIVDLHKDIISDKAQLESYNYFPSGASDADTRSATSVGIYYIMKDGRTMLRTYLLPVTKELLQDAGSPVSEYLAIRNDPSNILSRTFPQGLTEYNFQNGEIYTGYDAEYDAGVKYDAGFGTNNVTVTAQSRQTTTLSQAQSYALYQAIVKDIKAGNIGKTYLLTDEVFDKTVYTYSIILHFDGTFPDWSRNYGTENISDVASFQLETGSVNTLAALKDMGLLDERRLITQGAERNARTANARFAGIPDDVTAFYMTYMEAAKTGTKKAVQYTHFESRNKTAYLESNDHLIDYKIVNIEKINDNLFAFTVSVVSAYAREGKPEMVYNFVGKINGQMYIMLSTAEIPADIRENFNPDNYKYTDPDVLGSGS